MKLLRCHASARTVDHPRFGRRGGFTLIEVLAVVAVIAILLSISVMAIGPSGGPQARRAARDAVAAMMTRARSEAIASGKLTAVAFVGLKDGPSEYRGRSMTLYEVKRDEVTGSFEAVKQLRRWVNLPRRTILLGSDTGAGDPDRAMNALDEAAVLTVKVPGEGANAPLTVEAPCIVFEPTGSVSHPPGSGRIGIHIGEGTWQNDSLLITARTDSGDAVADTVYLSRLTGRARSLEGSTQ